MTWRTDEGLKRLDEEWRKRWPNAVIYHIGDTNHDTDPDVSQHAPDDGGPLPGDDRGEVDAGDYMPSGGPDLNDLWQAFVELNESRDKRILYVICRNKIFSSVVRPWEIRTYKGKYHSHLHVSVNDNFDNNQSDWEWEKMAARTRTFFEINGHLPVLMKGDEDDAWDGWDNIRRAQALANVIDGSVPDIDTDGVYGGGTARKIAAIMKNDPNRTTTNGTKIGEPEWRRLVGW